MNETERRLFTVRKIIHKNATVWIMIFTNVFKCQATQTFVQRRDTHTLSEKETW